MSNQEIFSNLAHLDRQPVFQQPYINRPMGILNAQERKILEREVGELCPRLEFTRFYKPKGLGLWQIDTEDYLKFRCPAKDGKIPSECETYRTYCAFMLENNDLLRGFDLVY